ncbi:hypothetical protein GIB67_041663 [Kingdonia uniflora]|uniref:Glutathione peroxidase n=1 Tax=Kingdonia uniflora TaxID=39325 RepID=A0A7J7MQZ9_9MAGN|nr:hypothetical protein GIB67_041663 [Kingdonia uniflora]
MERLSSFVQGSNQSSLFLTRCNNFLRSPCLKNIKYFSCSKGFLGDLIKWNFEKFSVDKNGKVVERYVPTTSPLDIEVSFICYCL